jgi:pyrroloquinoline quinone (PQQ) biosynthesis protein C
VAACQIGLDGDAKLELARNYWDEMGNGSLDAVHTELHRRLAAALGLHAVPRSEQPIQALERAALGSVLATNRHLQPETVGALGLIELQAGPRCRRVVKALRRLDAPADAFPFYEEHAVADPRHGKDWLDHAVATLAEDPEWASGMVRGARWRSLVNRRFFGAMEDRFATRAEARQAS